MIDNICKHHPEITPAEFEDSGYKFSDIAREFLKKVPQDTYKKILWNHFTKVRIGTTKENFLKCGWPYIYTLNIDDGIEANSQYEPILPYKSISDTSRSMFNCLYKMHGDVREELKYDEIKNVIFSRDQYINSLLENASLLRYFQSDFSTNNLIFLGCSLDDELDLEFAINTNKGTVDAKAERIYVTSTKPTGLRMSRLEDFNVTKILLVGDYNKFYEFIFEIYQVIQTEDNDLLKPFRNIEIKVYDKSLEDNKKYLLDIVGAKSSEYTLPYFNTKTRLVAEVLTSLSIEPISVVSGKRFCGKTFLAKQIASSIQNTDVYFFPSNISVGTNDIEQVLSKKDSVFIFDTNTVDVDLLYTFKNNIGRLKKNNSNLIILVNKSDGILHGYASRLTQQNYYYIDDIPSQNDISNLNKRLTQLGLVNSKAKTSFLENCYRYFEVYNEPLPFDVGSISKPHFQLLLVIAAEEKAYSVFFNIIGLMGNEVDSFVKKMSPFIELTGTDELELHLHSGSKLISNSSSWLFRILNEIHKQKGPKIVSDYIFDTIKTLLPVYLGEIAAKKIISFDFLNQAFSRRGIGSIKLIESIYSQLESILFNDGHFWLQRSKSLLYLYREDLTNLEIASKYATKAYHDTSSEKQKINATTTLALISGRIANIKKFEKDSVETAIEWYFKTLQENEHNIKYIDDILEGTRRKSNDLRNLCSHLMIGGRSFSGKLKSQAEYIIKRVRMSA